jgi:hypothetical protein
MMWENDDNYNELSMGYPSNISGMTRVQVEVLLLIVYWAMQKVMMKKIDVQEPSVWEQC